ncbi:DgyrCDS3756 [Dimorphilus gyrociliatus]|nr:DgyrCDS3756 [Dimorphilus gyrociliatus]
MSSKECASVIASLEDVNKNLTQILNYFQKNDIDISHLETRNSKNKSFKKDILLSIETPKKLDSIVKDIQKVCPNVEIQDVSNVINGNETVWFPRKISDLDNITRKVLMYGSELDADHPGFKDEAYRKRRLMFADIAFNYKHGIPIPRVEYTETETKTWKTIYKELHKIYPTHACKEYLENWPLLEKECGYSENNIPQLEDVSNFLKTRTGFSVRPVAGYLTPRDFLSGLAFRVFHCTQYIRHSTDPFYTPEPDCCHELLGHVPLFANKEFAQFSQEIGLASIGASDEEVQKLATCYFFTVEFGLCKQNGKLRVYGAGLLSSIGELKHALTDKAVIKEFEPEITAKQEPLVTTFQDCYFYSNSFEDAKEKLRKFAKTIKRPFEVRYDPVTQSLEILDDPTKVSMVLESVQIEINTLMQALLKMQ